MASDAPVRLFLALELTEAVRVRLADWASGVPLGAQNQRPVSMDALHVTLVFLGPTRPERVRPVWEATTRAARSHEAPHFEPDGVRALPVRRPSLLALGLRDDGRAAALQGDVADALVRGGLHERERRPFWPHVTLVRFTRTARLQVLPAEPVVLPSGLDAPALTLYRSEPSPSGARYSGLERLRLADA